MNNFVQAILNDTPLMVPTEQGLASLDVANAMLLSTWQKRNVTLPLDRTQYQQQLAEKVAHSSLREKSNQQANIDMQQSYR